MPAMFRRFVMILILLSTGSPRVWAQDQNNNPDALRKELADTLAQLKTAQDRKNELGNENEKLKAQLAAMQKQLDELQRASTTWAEQTYWLRSREAAWAAFVGADPRLKARWELFLETAPPDISHDLTDSPFAKPAPASIADLIAQSATAPSTAPSTAPASAPASGPASPPPAATTTTAPATAPTTTPSTNP
jgi:hypothetical protein